MSGKVPEILHRQWDTFPNLVEHRIRNSHVYIPSNAVSASLHLRFQATQYRTAFPTHNTGGTPDPFALAPIYLEWQKSSYAYHLFQIISHTLSEKARQFQKNYG